MDNKTRILQLGAGLVGGAMAIDLAADPSLSVCVADRDQGALDRLHALGIDTKNADLSDPSKLTALAADADLVLSAVPGHMGYQTLEVLLEAGKNVVDIAFFAEDPFELDNLAKRRGVVAVVDCGVAPGMSNVLTGYAAGKLEQVDRALTYVGGLPEVRTWPFEYKAVFSPIDVIEEYTRPARFIENGKAVVRPALSDAMLMDCPQIGTLEAFNSDGLRTLAQTIDCPNMKEMTLRYPGHIEKMALLRACGFFSKEEVDVKGQKLRPLDLTAALLFPKWELGPGEVDITVMRVIVEGRAEGERVCYQWDLDDRYDPVTKTHSMARTTGYTATGAVRLLAAGLYDSPGITPPEQLGRDPKLTEFMLQHLRERGVIYQAQVTRSPLS